MALVFFLGALWFRERGSLGCARCGPASWLILWLLSAYNGESNVLLQLFSIFPQSLSPTLFVTDSRTQGVLVVLGEVCVGFAVNLSNGLVRFG